MSVTVDRRSVVAGALAAGLVAPALAGGLVTPAIAGGRRLHQVFVGSYSWAPGETKTGDFGPADLYSDGIYGFAFDPASGRAGPVTLAVATANPANLILHPGRRFLYAGTSRRPIEQGQHRLTAFAIEGATLRELGHVASGGGVPTQGAVDRAGRNLVTANFDSDNVVCVPLGRDGMLGPVASHVGRAPGELPASDAPAAPRATIGAPPRRPREQRTRPHMALFSPDQRFVVATEIGRDACLVLAYDSARSQITDHGEAKAAVGAGPRHIAWHPGGRHLYSADETGSTITLWRWTASTGSLVAVQQVGTVPGDWSGANHPAHVAVHPGGRFVYVSNRGHGSIAGFRIADDGRVAPSGWTMLGTPVCWHFVFDPSGRWLIAANQSNSVTQIFACDPARGTLADTGQRLVTPMPTSLVIV